MAVTPPPPKTATELLHQITADYPQLSKRLQQVAHYVQEHPNNIAFETIVVISKDARVHPSTLIRFANAFGYNGFSEMQRLFKDKLLQDAPSYNDRIRIARATRGEEAESPAELLEQLILANTVALAQLQESIHPEHLEQAIELLSRAHCTHVIGMRRAHPVASYLTYAIRHLKKKARIIDGADGMIKEQIEDIDDADVLIAISFRPYVDEALKSVETATARNIPVIAITDSQLSPLARETNVCFVIKEADIMGFRSLSASHCLAQSIVMGLGYRLDSKQQEKQGARSQPVATV